MSGEKHVLLREREYHRIMQATRQVVKDQARIQALDRQLAQARQCMQEQQRATQARQQAFEQTVDRLSQEVQQSARTFQRRLQEQQHAFEQSVAALDQRLTEQRAEYLKLLNEQADYMQQQFERIEQRERTAEQAARQWLADADTIMAYIAAHQKHQQFAPGELEALHTEYRSSAANIQQGHYQAAIATAQVLYRRALHLQAEIEFRQLEWNTYHAELHKNARTLLAEMEVQTTAQWVLDTEAGSQSVEAEIDYWSDGSLTRLMQQMQQELTTLETQAETLTLDDLKQRLAAHADTRAELERLIAGAKERLIASQLRVNIAQDILGELEQSGWEVVESTWQGAEADGARGWKNSYHVKLRDLGHNEMVTVILPEPSPNGPVDNRVQFAYYPRNNNDAGFAARQTQHMNATLQRLGLTQETLQCVPGHERTIVGDARRLDFSQIRRQQVTESQSA